MAIKSNHRLNMHVQGWLMVLPAVVLLAAFTHVPAVATFIDSFYSTPRPNRPSRLVKTTTAS